MAPSARKRFGGPEQPKARPSKAKFNSVTFDDHTGKPAIMSWSGSEDMPNLPDLRAWIFYMVNPETPRDFDGCAFASGLKEGRMLLSASAFRYEFFFLPGATAEECVAHYRGEMAARGTIWQQVRKVERAWKKKRDASEETVDDPAEGLPSGDDDEPRVAITSEGLPGLPWVKKASDWYFTHYRSWLFMYLDADVQWGPDQDHDVCLVQFDPMPIEWEEGARVGWDPMEHPIRSKHIKAMSRLGDEESLIYWMGDRGQDNWALVARDASNDAKDLGWETW
ncbi:unnamed protein product [Clonostachys solani]|uniref:Uncharacterized protein n=1 Tax=Clonostachys solani TaxID=160281 RepID=A0A9N9ZNG7_9HYPO|nr:unnamed protein product [Clonostachys solani]